jgi:translation elongation factor EF-Tu-like GTPase
MNKTPDFIAELHYLTTEQGGRKTPAWSGYRPQVKFGFSEMQTSGQQKFIDKEIVYPGDFVKAEISIISVDFFKNKLKIGLDFEFREASRVIGTGKIIEILNIDLLAI